MRRRIVYAFCHKRGRKGQPGRVNLNFNPPPSGVSCALLLLAIVGRGEGNGIAGFQRERESVEHGDVRCPHVNSVVSLPGGHLMAPWVHVTSATSWQVNSLLTWRENSTADLTGAFEGLTRQVTRDHIRTDRSRCWKPSIWRGTVGEGSGNRVRGGLRMARYM